MGQTQTRMMRGKGIDRQADDSARSEQAILDIASHMLTTAYGAHIRHRKDLRSGHYLHIRRGFYLNRDSLPAENSLWQHQRTIAIARHIAHYATHHHIDTFTHQSALLLRGLPVLHRPGEIHERRQASKGRHLVIYPPVSLEGQLLCPSSMAVIHTGSSLGDHAELLGGLPVTSLRETARDILTFSQPAAAIAEVSMLMRHASGYDRWQKEESDARALAVRTLIGEAIDEVDSPWGRQRAHELLALCDPSCESIAEGYFNWFLHAFNARPWQTQVEIKVNGVLYLADFCFPAQRVLIEVEGFSKLGTQQDDIGRHLNALMRRDNILTSHGWNLIHLPARQMYVDPLVLYAHLREIIGSIFMPTPPRRWLLDS